MQENSLREGFARIYTVVGNDLNGNVNSVLSYPTLEMAENAISYVKEYFEHNGLPSPNRKIYVNSVLYNGEESHNRLSKY